MARIAESEIERLKLQVSLVRLIESAGVVLKPHGADVIGRCPFHDDKTPSLVVSPKTNLWHCLGACQAGGSVIDWVMRLEGVSFRHAVELLRNDYLPLAAGSPVKQSTVRKLSAPVAFDADDRALLCQVIDYYHATLKTSPEALAYLKARGIDHAEALDTFKLGYANRTLGLRLPDKNRVAGADIRTRLQRVGVYRASGHEHLCGSLVIPVIAPDGEITESYGRKLRDDLRPGTPRHLYLPGPHCGVWNEQALQSSKEIILCESLIDALTFWCAGYRNVTASYGVEGFTADHLAAFARHGTQRVLIAYDRDAAGDAAAEKLATQLIAVGIACYRIVFPQGMDANEYALAMPPASESLGVAIRAAQWLGNGATLPITTAPLRESNVTLIVEAEPVRQESIKSDAAETPPAPELPPLAAALAASPPAALPASPLPPTAPPLPVEIVGDELRLGLGDRAYRVRGIEKNPSYEQLKVWIKAQRETFVHIDTVELYTARQRQAWIKQASIELGLSEDAIKADLAALLRAVELRQDELIRGRQTPNAKATSTPALSAEQREEALALLRDPKLIERIVADVAALGVVGEDSNALVSYLACVSRKLDKPLAILIQSTSAAGKSTLMDALLSLLPESERVHYSAMTGQSLFYLGEGDLKHKVLAIAEEEGVRQAAYALKLLQSQGELTIASTGKDPTTGKLVTEEYRVEGPVMLFLTTTAIEIDEELLNRCLVLTINESREQTQAIHRRQRQARTLAGLMAAQTATAIRRVHQDAQTLLRPLAVVNPYAEALTFRSESPRLRRDHAKYLTLIDAIAYLFQHQREIKHAGAIEYVEVTQDDIALANRLAAEVLGRSLDELPPQTRGVLGDVVAFVDTRARAQSLARGLVRFTRRELREATSRGDTQLKLHLARLEDHEYLIAHRNGMRHQYELVFDGDVAASQRQAIGLLDVATLTTAERSGSGVDRSAPGRDVVGGLSGIGRVDETLRHASADADVLPLVAAFASQPLLENEHAPRRRNGAAHAA
ncbi:MAG: CHC2 zinc finger domain-containing protein [Rudaea sp.]